MSDLTVIDIVRLPRAAKYIFDRKAIAFSSDV